MNDLAATIDFDYSLVSKETTGKLQALSNQLDGIYQNYSVVVGEVLYKAQQELASYDSGTFQKWVASKGISKSNAYNYINSYRLVQQLDNPKEREIFLKQPQRIKNEMSKPSANPEVNQAVFDGNIKTHKEYKELERQLNLARSANESLREQNERLAEQALKGLETKTIEKEVVKEIEVAPADYDATKSLNATLLEKNSQLKREYDDLNNRAEFIEEQYNKLVEERKAVDEKSAKYDELTEAIKQSQGQLSEAQAKIGSYKSLLSFIRKGNEMVVNMGGLVYVDEQRILHSDSKVRNEFEQLQKAISRLAEDMGSMLKETEVLEGEII